MRIPLLYSTCKTNSNPRPSRINAPVPLSSFFLPAPSAPLPAGGCARGHTAADFRLVSSHIAEAAVAGLGGILGLAPGSASNPAGGVVGVGAEDDRTDRASRQADRQAGRHIILDVVVGISIYVCRVNGMYIRGIWVLMLVVSAAGRIVLAEEEEL